MTLQERFAKMAKKFPKKVAIIDQATNKEFTYEKALISSIIFANKIKKYPEKNIGVMVPTSAGAMLTFIAVLMAGKTPVMINYSTGAIKNCKYAAERCNFKTILTSKKLLDKLNLEPIDGMYFLEDIVKDITLFDKISGLIKSKLNIFYKGDKEELAVVLFTSGSEKDPKGVMLTHKNIISNIDAILKTYPQITHKDTFLSSLPLFHVFGLTVTFWYPLLIGASMLSYPNPLEYSTISKLVKKYKLGIMVSTPSFLYGYLRKSNAGDFSSLKLCIAGADKVTSHLFESFKKKHGIEIMEGYGTTELSPVVSVNTPENFRLGSIGQPLPGVQVKILHIDTDKELGTNEIGKIFVKGDNLMKGYYDDPEETSFRIHNCWYDTGDMGMLDDDGFLWHKGRLKRFVKIGGEMVSLVEIESYLEALLPDDALCCVVDVPNMKKGADIVAAITTSDIDFKNIKKTLAKSLPSIAIPKEIHFMEVIPMMSSGKVNFREVEQICRNLHKRKK